MKNALRTAISRTLGDGSSGVPAAQALRFLSACQDELSAFNLGKTDKDSDFSILLSRVCSGLSQDRRDDLLMDIGTEICARFDILRDDIEADAGATSQDAPLSKIVWDEYGDGRLVKDGRVAYVVAVLFAMPSSWRRSVEHGAVSEEYVAYRVKDGQVPPDHEGEVIVLYDRSMIVPWADVLGRRKTWELAIELCEQAANS